jgi:hypothetical protein
MKARLVLLVVLLTLVSATLLIFRSRNSNALLRIQPERTITAAAPYIGSLITWDDYIAWIGYSDPSGKDAHVLLYDLESKKTKTLAKGFSVTGGPAWVRGSKDALVYLSFARLACDDLPDDKKKAANCSSQPRGWQMFSVDVRSGKQRKISASKTEIDQRFPPLPELSWPYVVWTAPPAETSPRPTSRGIAVYDLEARKGKVMFTGTITGRTTVEGKTLVFTAAVPGADRWDLFAANVSGKGSLRKLTTSGKVIFPRVSDGLVAWQEPSASNPNQSSTDLSPWVRSISGEDHPVRIATKGSNPFPGDGFVVWISSPAGGGQLLAKDPRSKQEPIVVEQQPAFAAGWWAFGDRLVWATTAQQDDKAAVAIHIARMQVG